METQILSFHQQFGTVGSTARANSLSGRIGGKGIFIPFSRDIRPQYIPKRRSLVISNVTDFEQEAKDSLLVSRNRVGWEQIEFGLSKAMGNSSNAECQKVFETAVLTYNAAGEWNKLTDLIQRMMNLGMKPSRRLFLTVSKRIQNADDPKRLLPFAEQVLVHARTVGLKDVLPFNCVLYMYVKANLPDKALSLLQEMDSLGIVMDLYTFHCAMQAFGLQGNVEAAKDLMNWLCEHKSLRPTVHTFSIILRIYGEGQLMSEAMGMVETMRKLGVEADTAFFNSLLFQLGRSKMPAEAFSVYLHMKAAGPPPDLHTFKHLFLASAHSRKLSSVPEVLLDLQSWLDLQQGSSKKAPVFIVDALLRVCSACLSCLPHQSELAESILRQMESSWGWVPTAGHMNNLLIGYRKEAPLPRFILDKCRSLVQSGKTLTNFTWQSLVGYHFFRGHLTELLSCVSALRASGRPLSQPVLCMLMDVHGTHGNVKQAEAVFREIRESMGTATDRVSFVTLMNAYAEVGLPEESVALLKEMQSVGIRPDAKAWTLAIKAHGKADRAEGALELFREMMKARTRMDEIAYNTVLNVCGRLLPLDEARELHESMVREGFQANEMTENLLLSLLVKGNRLSEAEAMFKRMVRNQRASCVTYSTLVAAYGKRGDVEAMEEVFEECRRRREAVGLSVSVYNAAMDGYGNVGQLTAMEAVMEKMEQDGIRPNLVTFNTLIHCYGANSKVAEMEAVMERQAAYGIKKDLWTYNILIGAYGGLQMPHASVKVFRDMQDAGLQPDEYTYGNLVRAFRVSGDYLEAARWSMWMKQAGFELDAWMSDE